MKVLFLTVYSSPPVVSSYLSEGLFPSCLRLNYSSAKCVSITVKCSVLPAEAFFSVISFESCHLLPRQNCQCCRLQVEWALLWFFFSVSGYQSKRVHRREQRAAFVILDLRKNFFSVNLSCFLLFRAGFILYRWFSGPQTSLQVCF